MSPDGRTLASSGMDGRVIIRDLPSGKLRHMARTIDADPAQPAPRRKGPRKDSRVAKPVVDEKPAKTAKPKKKAAKPAKKRMTAAE